MNNIERGALRHRMILETPQDNTDDIGAVIRTYTALTSVWAAIKPLSASRLWQSQQVQQQVSHRITIGYRPDVTGDMRLRLDARIFQIKASYDAEERGRFLTLECLEIKP